MPGVHGRPVAYGGGQIHDRRFYLTPFDNTAII